MTNFFCKRLEEKIINLPNAFDDDIPALAKSKTIMSKEDYLNAAD
jgi:hypothetical protein